MGGGIAGVALSLQRSSPLDASEPILDFPLALMFTPVLLLGVAIGAPAPLCAAWCGRHGCPCQATATHCERLCYKHAAGLCPLGHRGLAPVVKSLRRLWVACARGGEAARGAAACLLSAAARSARRARGAGVLGNMMLPTWLITLLLIVLLLSLAFLTFRKAIRLHRAERKAARARAAALKDPVPAAAGGAPGAGQLQARPRSACHLAAA